MDGATGAELVKGLGSAFRSGRWVWLVAALAWGCAGTAAPTHPSKEQLAAVEGARSSPGEVLGAALEAMTRGDFATFYLLLEPTSQGRELLAACEDAAWPLVTQVLDPKANVEREVDKVSAVLERHGRDPDAVEEVMEALGPLSSARMHVAARKRLAALYARQPGEAAIFYAELMRALGRAKPIRTAQREVTDLRIAGDRAEATIVDVDTGKSWPASFVRIRGGWYLVTEESITTQLGRLGGP